MATFFYAQESLAKMRRLLDRSVDLAWMWLGIFLILGVVTKLTGHRGPLALPLLLFTASLGHALHLRDESGDRRYLPLTLAAVVVVPLGSFLGVHGAVGDWRPFGYGLSYLVGIAFFWAFYARRAEPVARPLTWLGDISYAAYLIHPRVALALLRLYGRQDWSSVIANLAVTPVVAYVVHRFIERPSIDAGRALTRRSRAPVEVVRAVVATGRGEARGTLASQRDDPVRASPSVPGIVAQTATSTRPAP